MQRYVCASKHFLQYMISIKHEICSSRIEWFSILQIKEMHNLRPPKIPLRHTKDVSDVWHVYPQAVSMWNQYVPSFVYKILRALQQNLIKFRCTWCRNIKYYLDSLPKYSDSFYASVTHTINLQRIAQKITRFKNFLVKNFLIVLVE